MKYVLSLLALVLSAALQSHAATYYVAPSGNDGGVGSSLSPFRTVARAVSAVKAGDTVVLKDGTYNVGGGSGSAFALISASGAAGSPITLMAERAGGAILDGQNNVDYGFIWNTNASYWNITGIDFRNFVLVGIVMNESYSRNIELRQCAIHDIGRIYTTTEYGLCGIYSSWNDNVLIDRCQFYNIGRFQPSDGYDYGADENYKNHDHGLYLGDCDGWTISNCVFGQHKAGWPIQVLYKATNMRIVNNTFYGGNPNDRPGQILFDVGPVGADVSNNIFHSPLGGEGYGPSGIVWYAASGSATVRNNLTYLPGSACATDISVVSNVSVTRSGNIVDRDPRLINAPYDLHLSATSPAIDAGVNPSMSLKTDLEGVTRPQGTAYDIGAYEYGAAAPSPAPAPAPASLTVSATSVQPSATVSVVVANGPGNQLDWVGLYAVGSADTQELTWKYLSNSQSAPSSGVKAATLTFQMPSTPGTYEFRLFPNDGYAPRLATSPAVTVAATPQPSGPTLSVSATSAQPSASITVSLKNGPGNRTDWVGLYAVGSPDSPEIDWKYLNNSQTAPATGVTAATLTFSLPSAAGNYEFRLFPNDGYSPRLATSASVAVAAATSGGQSYSGTPMAIPGTINVAKYDKGGEGKAYHDLTAENFMSASWRPGEGVDTADGKGMGWIMASEWVNYTVNVSAAGTYTLALPACHPGPGGTFHVNFNGVNKTGTITAPNTGSWDVNQTISKSVNLSAGVQVMQIVFDTAGSTGYVCGIGNISLAAMPTGTG